MDRIPSGDVGEREAPEWIARGRIPSLDGLRAISIGLVLLAHSVSTRGFPGPRWLVEVRRFGGLGVDVFFVISGFLITLLLLRELARTGTVALRTFYARRTLRIVPAYAAYLLFLLAMARFGLIALRPIDWATASTYTVNFLTDLPGRWTIGHLWSLSVEEHFYLAWPLGLAILGRRWGFLALVLSILGGPVARVFLSRAGLDVNMVTPARLDTIGVGCLLAFVVTDPRTWPTAARLGRRADLVSLFAASGLVVSAGMLSSYHRYWLTAERSIEAALIAVVVLACISGPRSLVGRFLNAGPVTTIGVLSYSLYLWQQPFLNPTSDLAICRWPGNLALAVFAATLSNRLIERPMLAVKDRLGDRTGEAIASRARSRPAETSSAAARA